MQENTEPLPWPGDRDRDAALVIRTDRGDDSAWAAVRAEPMEAWGDGGFTPRLHFVDDPRWAGALPAQVLAAAGHKEHDRVAYLADGDPMRQGRATLLALSLLTRDDCESDEEFAAYGGAFRTVPAGVHEMNANLMIANLDFADFAQAAADDPEGVFRGFAG